MNSGGGKTQTVTQTSQPWDQQKPFLTYGFDEAKKLYQDRPTQFYPGQTFVGFSPESEAALTAQADRARSGNPLLAGAQDLAGRTIAGDFLNSNPHADAAFEKIAGGIRSQIDAAAGRAGRTRSGAYANALASGVGDAATDFYGKLYEAERGRQEKALGYAPALAAEDYRDIAALLQTGAAREGKSAEELADDMNRYYAQFNLPREDLANYLGMVQGNYGGTTTSQQPTNSNPLGQALGTGLGLASLGSSLFGTGFLKGLF